jgi:D-xylose transport system permease protein
MTATTTSTTAEETAAPLPPGAPRSTVQEILLRFRTGDLGYVPVLVGLAVIWGIFQAQEPAFLSPINLTNLLLQVASIGTISVGVVLVLLLGEVDLSVGSVSGLTAAIMAVLNVKMGFGAGTAILLALLAGLAVGSIHGFFVTRFGVPSFVVTLAALIGWQGLQLQVLGVTGTINLPPSLITELTSTFLPQWAGWVLAAAVTVVYGVAQVLRSRKRTANGLPARSLPGVAVRTAFVAVCLVVATAVLNASRGVPLAVLIFLGFMVVVDLVLTHTRYGRSIFAIGGNAEAARRAGIRVKAIRLSVFAIAGFMAAAGGVLASARLVAVNQSSGSGDVLLNAIAAAVIGGTSLFGGRGSAYSALLGVLVIGSVSNGIDLIGLGAPIKLMITGAVLLAAVTLDALARRTRRATGRQ